ncbi:MAG: hypothetical protein IJQ23_00230 [Clostridia bacterium]|nr:hypothetical protein [Clostridia bacterium]
MASVFNQFYIARFKDVLPKAGYLLNLQYTQAKTNGIRTDAVSFGIGNLIEINF